MNPAWIEYLTALALSLPAATSTAAAAPGQASPLSALAQLPIREVTIFKDGHAFVLHEGTMPVEGSGNVVMDYLPTPVLGTFWAHSADTKARLTSVVASQHRVRVDRTALNLRELIEGNVGARVIVSEMPAGPNAQPHTYPATIVEVPQRSGEELDRTGLPNSGEKLPEKGTVVLFETEAGTRVVPFDRILDVTFQSTPRPQSTREEFRNLLNLHLEWQGGKAATEAAVGMSYLQKGMRWIPNYKVDLDGKGRATVEKVSWKVTLEAGKAVDLTYAWNYYWR